MIAEAPASRDRTRIERGTMAPLVNRELAVYTTFSTSLLTPHQRSRGGISYRLNDDGKEAAAHIAQNLINRVYINGSTFDDLRASLAEVGAQGRSIPQMRKDIRASLIQSRSANGHKLTRIERREIREETERRLQTDPNIQRTLAKRHIIQSVVKRVQIYEERTQREEIKGQITPEMLEEFRTDLMGRSKRVPKSEKVLINALVSRMLKEKKAEAQAQTTVVAQAEDIQPQAPVVELGQVRDAVAAADRAQLAQVRAQLALTPIGETPPVAQTASTFSEQELEAARRRLRARQARLDELTRQAEADRARRNARSRQGRGKAIGTLAAGIFSMVMGLGVIRAASTPTTAERTAAARETARPATQLILQESQLPAHLRTAASTDVLGQFLNESGESVQVVNGTLEPSVGERVAVNFSETVSAASSNNCFRIARIISPDTGALSVAEVLVQNDLGLQDADFDAFCREVFPQLRVSTDNPYFQRISAPERTNLLANREMAAKKDKLLFVKGTENGFYAFRQSGLTCFLITASSIASHIRIMQGYAGIAPLTLSDMVQAHDRERRIIAGEEVDLSRAAGLQREGSVNLSPYNITPEDMLRNAELAKALGLRYEVEAIDPSIWLDEEGNERDIQQLIARNTNPKFSDLIAQKLITQYKHIIEAGGYPIFVSNVDDSYDHAMAIVAIEEGDQPALYVREPIDAPKEREPGWAGVRGNWRLVPGTGGMIKIPLNLQTLKMFFREDRDGIPVFYPGEEPTFDNRLRQQMIARHNQEDAAAREARGVRI